MKAKQLFIGLSLIIITGSVLCFGSSYKGKKEDTSAPNTNLAVSIPKQTRGLKSRPNNTSPSSWQSSYSKGLGHIGYSKQEGSDRANDNLFFIELSKAPKAKDRVYLVFDVKGIANATGVSFQVNDNLSQGGYLISKGNAWETVKQEVQYDCLHKGQNMVLFTQAQNANFAYEVKNIHFEILPEKAERVSIVGASYKNFQYVRGILRAKASKVELLGQELPIRNGAFEGLVSNKQNEIAKLFITWSNGQRKAYHINNEALATLDFSRPYEERGHSVTKVFQSQKLDSLTFLGSSLKVSKLALQKDKRVEVLSLRGSDIPALNYAMTNVTGATDGYRFLPHGEHFSKDGAIVSLSYDRTKIPSGYSENDIRTFYFDLNAKQWIALKRIKIDKKNARIISQTSHFTDMINGIIKAPESPDTEGFVPTTMSNIKAADPAAKVNIIAPPTANNFGSANLQYSFELPPARNGMTPNLSISYNSNGGDGWLGEGWELPIPKITIDTRWGVPRYNPDIETETYSLSGMMLVTAGRHKEMSVAHRGEKIERQENRQFYTRLGGDFSKIIRKGNSPESYTWEVTDKRGVTYIYGENSACLKGVVNGKEVIAEWLLSKVIEPHGDWIEYRYRIDEEEVLGGLKAKAIYLEEIRAGYGQGTKNIDLTRSTPHTTIYFVSDSLKNIKRNNARYGFLTSSHKLLNHIIIQYSYNTIVEKKTLRSYKFIYKKGAFNRKLLSEVQHLDNQNKVFSFQKFDYHNDIVLDENNCKLFSNNIETWNPEFDDISSGPINASAIDGTESKSYGLSAYVGCGTQDFSIFKNLTGGLQYSYNNSTSIGKVMLIDLNGDGLLDKVFEKGGQVYFRAQSKNSTFSDKILVRGLSLLSKVKYYSHVLGPKANAGFAKVGISLGTSYSFGSGETLVYFKDVNGDGLIDQCRDGQVYFNHLGKEVIIDPLTKEEIRVPVFTTNSADTDSPLDGNGDIDISSYELSEKEISQQIQNAPILDIVRTWVAPFSGNIKIESKVKRILPKDINSQEYKNADGLRVAIQKGGQELWNKAIQKDDVSSYDADLYNLYVNKGERVYFRVQSGVDSLRTDGNYDKVEWSPIITYTDRRHEIMPNGHIQNIFDAKEGYVYSSNAKTLIPENIETFNLKGKLIKPVSSDDIELRVYGSVQQTEATTGTEIDEKLLWRRVISKSEDFNGEITAQIENPKHFTALKFVIYASTNVAWENIQWKPKVVYNKGEDVEVIGKVKYCGYPNIIKEAKPNFLEKVKLNEVEEHNRQFSYELHPTLEIYEVSKYANVKDSLIFTISARFNNNLIAKKEYKLTDFSQSRKLVMSPLEVTSNALIGKREIDSENVYFEVFVEKSPKRFNINLLPKILTFTLEKHGACVFDNIHITHSSHILNTVGFYAPTQDLKFGEMYGCWGAFVYNGAEERSYHPIREEDLEFPKDSTHSNILTMPFIPLSKSDTKNRLQGLDPDVFIEGAILSASRLGQKSITTNPMANLKKFSSSSTGQNYSKVYYAPRLQSSDDGGVFTLGSSIPSGIIDKFKIEKLVQETAGNLSGNLCFSFGTKKTENFFIDMNGDGYPDWISQKDIQYTNSRGGLAEKTNEYFTQENKSLSLSGGNGAEGTKSISLGQGPDKGASLFEIASINGNFGISGEGAFNWDEENRTLLDINGDGLPDKLIKDRETLKVQINLGYSFSEEKTLAYRENLGKSKTISTNLGTNVGSGVELLNNKFNIGGGSFSGGFGYTQSQNKSSYCLIDINGDGLPDKVRQETNSIQADNTVYIKFNTGNGFTDKEYKIQDGFISHSSSKVGSRNLSGTVNFFIPPELKLSLTLGISGSIGVSSSMSTLTDIDGDGYLDMVSSNTDDKLEVRRSNLGCINKLRRVENSLGGTFFLDYDLSETSSEAGGRKWVMSEVVVDDGIQDDGPLMKTQFEYKNGKKDRGEREFLGFGEVITKQINTEGNDDVYRRYIKKYDVSNYYRRGNLLETRIEDTNGKVYTKTINGYEIYEIKVRESEYHYRRNPNIESNHAAALSLLCYSENRQFDPKNQSSLITSQEWNEYDTNSGKYAELIRYRYSDKGKLKTNGTGSYNYETQISYVNKANNILSLPTSVEVKGENGELLHRVTAQYDDRADIIEVSKQLDYSGTSATTKFTYDEYGNLLKKILPKREKDSDNELTYTYAYDDYGIYLKSFTNPLGLTGRIEAYDYDYGIALRTCDYNGARQQITVDNLGRVLSIAGPNELGDLDEEDYEYVEPLIRFEYQSLATRSNGGQLKPAYAVTKHYDYNNDDEDVSDNPIETITFVDGFGKTIQVKKDGVINENGTDKEVLLVSGRLKYDAFGRVITEYAPYKEELNQKTIFNPKYSTQLYSPTNTNYDILDRTLEISVQDNGSLAKTVFNYGIKDNLLLTTITDALGNNQETYMDGSGKTVKTVLPNDIKTEFTYDGIKRLISVRDPEGNQTAYSYDMADRQTSVKHPASGLTTFTYDSWGNILTKQTENLRKLQVYKNKPVTTEQRYISYIYDKKGRIKEIKTPLCPEDNVKYHYWGTNIQDRQNAGRLRIREDITGATEYSYGKQGEIIETTRSIILLYPERKLATYITGFVYDSFNRIREIRYPGKDGETVFYNYDKAGNLKKVYGSRNSREYYYIKDIQYDVAQRRRILESGNGAKTEYSYDNRQRLNELRIHSRVQNIIDNRYTYDLMSNITKVINRYNGMEHKYAYDNLYRLKKAVGSYQNNSKDYTLSMAYDNLGRITHKNLNLNRKIDVNNRLDVGYTLDYSYQTDIGKKFQISSILDKSHRSEMSNRMSTQNQHQYEYDFNGNITHIATEVDQKTGTAHERKLLWDCEDRLLAIADDGYLNQYFYDADGNRTIKITDSSENIWVNGQESLNAQKTENITTYISPYLVLSNGMYTKHIYAGGQRIVSAVYQQDENLIGKSPAGKKTWKVRYEEKASKLIDAIRSNYEHFGLPHNIKNYIREESSFFPKDRTKRKEQLRSLNRGANCPTDKTLLYFYHPDHLGSSSYITDENGDVTQHVEYIPFGEVFFEERFETPKTQQAREWQTPYLFNGKELDEETGLYYYGARYYDPRVSIWMSVDPLAEERIGLSPYSYCQNNPIMRVDPDGRLDDWYLNLQNGHIEHRKGNENYVNQGLVHLASDKATHRDILNELKKRNYTFLGLCYCHNGLVGYHVDTEKQFSAWKMMQITKEVGTVLMEGVLLHTSLKYLGVGNTSYPKMRYNRPVLRGNKVSKGNSLVPKNINLGQQGKHIFGHNNYTAGRSILSSDPKALLEGYHSGKFKTLRIFNNKVIVDFRDNIGIFYNGGNAVGPTRFGTIHYGKTGAHIVPANPVQF